MTEFIAQLLWVAVGDLYDGQRTWSHQAYEALCAAQDDLSKIWGSS